MRDDEQAERIDIYAQVIHELTTELGRRRHELTTPTNLRHLPAQT